MNILFFCYEYPPHPGGVGAYLLHMSRALVAAGHRAVVVAGKAAQHPAVSEEDGVVVYRLLERGRAGEAVDAVLAVIRTHAIDVIEGADHLGDIAALLRCRPRPPIWVKCHSCSLLHAAHEQAHALAPWQALMIKIARWRGWRQALAERCAIEGADGVFAPSRAVLEAMRSQGLRFGADAFVLPNPVPCPRVLTPEPESAQPRLLFVGRLDIGKGIQYLPGILEAVVREVPAVHLDIVGGSSYARGLGDLGRWLGARLGGLRERVTFHGQVTPAALGGFYARAWVVLVPSRWDTFPTVLLEAMSHGRAVVVSDRGGIPEMVEGCGVEPLPPGSAAFAAQVVRLLRDPAERARLGARLAARASEHYDPRAIAREYVRRARALVAAHRRGGGHGN